MVALLRAMQTQPVQVMVGLSPFLLRLTPGPLYRGYSTLTTNLGVGALMGMTVMGRG